MTYNCNHLCDSTYKDIAHRSCNHRNIKNHERYFCRMCSMFWEYDKVPNNKCLCCKVKMSRTPRRQKDKIKFKQRVRNEIIVYVK